jgi:hypothetical protein
MIQCKINGIERGKSLDQYPMDTGRLRRVVGVVAERSGWANKKPGKGRALGFAAHRSFLSYVAAVVDVEVDAQGQVRLLRVDLAVDAGTVVHPERVQAQSHDRSSHAHLKEDKRTACTTTCMATAEIKVQYRGMRHLYRHFTRVLAQGGHTRRSARTTCRPSKQLTRS